LATQDLCCTIQPYFKIHEGRMEDFKELCEKFVAKTSKEPKALYYGFSFDGDQVHCREGYKDAEAVLYHLKNVASVLAKALKIADLTRLEIHGPKEELKKLREPLASLKPQFFTLELGFRRGCATP
jgi:quinol monooxygenase YgiN